MWCSLPNIKVSQAFICFQLVDHPDGITATTTATDAAISRQLL